MDCYVALGSNLGDRGAYLSRGLAGLAGAGWPPRDLSSVWETSPVGVGGGAFWNMVVRIEADAAPRALLAALQAIERAAGRARARPDGARTLDLDLLLADGLTLDEPGLTLPHPRMWSRRFVLEPLAEIAPTLRDPRGGDAVAELCRRAAGNGERVRRLGGLAEARLYNPTFPLEPASG